MYERPVLRLHSRSWQDFDALGKKSVFPVEFYPNGGFAKGDSHHCPAVFLELTLSVFTFMRITNNPLFYARTGKGCFSNVRLAPILQNSTNVSGSMYPVLAFSGHISVFCREHPLKNPLFFEGCELKQV
ncbi:MAG: hypothetical protein LUP97_03000, partial [Methanoregula sp.]|nr:hypothetical protein [Methanoregula sp.]